jgi:hypothetical protein
MRGTVSCASAGAGRTGFPKRKFRSRKRGNLMQRMRLPLFLTHIVPM